MIVLERYCYSEKGTFGRLRVGDFECYTVERPWIQNEPNISCIPDGTYKIGLAHFNAGGYDTLEIEGVAGRTHILFHRGNWPESVQGCIALGISEGILSNKRAVLHSSQAFDNFWAAVKDDPPRTIQIRQAPGTVFTETA